MIIEDNEESNGDENAAYFEVPEWQVKLGKEELKNIAEGHAELLSWEEAREQLRIA